MRHDRLGLSTGCNAEIMPSRRALLPLCINCSIETWVTVKNAIV